jgi:GH43 family beta-xylosidase
MRNAERGFLKIPRSAFVFMQYQNPVYPHDFPDPFVFKFCGEYYAVGTGYWHDGGALGMLRSRDLINWHDAGSALNPAPFDAPCYWAPEIFYDNGKFYLYYSVGNEENMEIRVAVADSPIGKYLDSGHRLTTEQFAIDAHVFVDDDNSRWLFYATDFLEHSHVGTGTVRDRLTTPFQLEGKPQAVSRARYDWQVYDPQRANKGNVRWHTIEGSSVVKRKGVYYQMFSGGNWQNPTYGVSFATTRDISAQGEWQQFSDGEKILPILRTVPGKVVGPGHNCVVRAPDNRQLFCVYHRWADDLQRGRLLSIDPLDFAGERMLVLGASVEPQNAPNRPSFADYFEQDKAQGLGVNWVCSYESEWLVNGNAAVSVLNETVSKASAEFSGSCFLAEVSCRAINFSETSGFYGFELQNAGNALLQCAILPLLKQIKIVAGDESETFDLPVDFEPKAFHLWRVELDARAVKIKLDEANFHFQTMLPDAAENFALVAQNVSAAFAAVEITAGFEDLFEWRDGDFAARGWEMKVGEKSAWQIGDGRLNLAEIGSPANALLKTHKFQNFELIGNFRFKPGTTKTGVCGFYLKQQFDELLLTIKQNGDAPQLSAKSSRGERHFDLPDFFTAQEFTQFRFRRIGERMFLQCETAELGEISIAPGEAQIGLYAQGANAEFEMLRVTKI